MRTPSRCASEQKLSVEPTRSALVLSRDADFFLLYYAMHDLKILPLCSPARVRAVWCFLSLVQFALTFKKQIKHRYGKTIATPRNSSRWCFAPFETMYTFLQMIAQNNSYNNNNDQQPFLHFLREVFLLFARQ